MKIVSKQNKNMLIVIVMLCLGISPVGAQERDNKPVPQVISANNNTKMQSPNNNIMQKTIIQKKDVALVADIISPLNRIFIETSYNRLNKVEFALRGTHKYLIDTQALDLLAKSEVQIKRKVALLDLHQSMKEAVKRGNIKLVVEYIKIINTYMQNFESQDMQFLPLIMDILSESGEFGAQVMSYVTNAEKETMFSLHDYVFASVLLRMNNYKNKEEVHAKCLKLFRNALNNEYGNAIKFKNTTEKTLHIKCSKLAAMYFVMQVAPYMSFSTRQQLAKNYEQVAEYYPNDMIIGEKVKQYKAKLVQESIGQTVKNYSYFSERIYTIVTLEKELLCNDPVKRNKAFAILTKWIGKAIQEKNSKYIKLFVQMTMKMMVEHDDLSSAMRERVFFMYNSIEKEQSDDLDVLLTIGLLRIAILTKELWKAVSYVEGEPEKGQEAIKLMMRVSSDNVSRQYVIVKHMWDFTQQKDLPREGKERVLALCLEYLPKFLDNATTIIDRKTQQKVKINTLAETMMFHVLKSLSTKKRNSYIQRLKKNAIDNKDVQKKIEKIAEKF